LWGALYNIPAKIRRVGEHKRGHDSCVRAAAFAETTITRDGDVTPSGGKPPRHTTQ
jgi:hypothetical protein